MFMLGLLEAIDKLAMANSVHWYGHVLRRSFDFEVKGRKGGRWGHKRGRLRKKV